MRTSEWPIPLHVAENLLWGRNAKAQRCTDSSPRRSPFLNRLEHKRVIVCSVNTAKITFSSQHFLMHVMLPAGVVLGFSSVVEHD